MNNFLYPREFIFYNFSTRFHIPWKQRRLAFALKIEIYNIYYDSFKQLQNASRRALDLWSRDAPSVGFPAPRSKDESEISYYAQTLIGNGSRDALSHSPAAHRILCNNCHRVSQNKKHPHRLFEPLSLSTSIDDCWYKIPVWSLSDIS